MTKKSSDVSARAKAVFDAMDAPMAICGEGNHDLGCQRAYRRYVCEVPDRSNAIWPALCWSCWLDYIANAHQSIYHYVQDHPNCIKQATKKQYAQEVKRQREHNRHNS